MKKTAMMELIDILDNHISKHKAHANKFDTGAMIAKSFAITLLKTEMQNIEDAFDVGAIDSRTGLEYYKDKYGKDN